MTTSLKWHGDERGGEQWRMIEGRHSVAQQPCYQIQSQTYTVSGGNYSGTLRHVPTLSLIVSFNLSLRFVYLSFAQFLSNCLLTYPPNHLLFYLSIYSSIHRSIFHLSVRPSVHPSIHPLYCIVFIHFYSASHSLSLSEALPTTAIDTVSEFTRRSATGNCR